MPGYNGTGPWGRGAETGRGFGPCRGYRPLFGWFRGGGFYGRGAGRGAGRGPFRWWAGEPEPAYGPAWSSPEDERTFLKNQAEELKAELAEMEQRMAELEGG